MTFNKKHLICTPHSHTRGEAKTRAISDATVRTFETRHVMNAVDQQRVASTQRSYLMAILFLFLFFSASDFTPAKTRRNANAGVGSVNKGSSESARRRDEVRDKVRSAIAVRPRDFSLALNCPRLRTRRERDTCRYLRIVLYSSFDT